MDESTRIWRDRVARWHKSGHSARVFAEQEGVNAGTLYSWSRRLGNGTYYNNRTHEAGGSYSSVAKVPPTNLVPISPPFSPPQVTLRINNIGFGANVMGAGTVVNFSFSDPNGPGESDYGRYDIKWELERNGARRVIYPKNFLGRRGQKLILVKDHSPIPECANGYHPYNMYPYETIKLLLSVTDPDGDTGTASVEYGFRSHKRL
ncbi:IS66 family insertion sequence element accessory protein TnpA [Sorangium sp. So ce1151]|uniref:IS66 family insertion sequence element accessory protein TnpA n=1 Tax=Sorangium sp. So ce1151 TaxID=3133332 RepID=UPI003F5F23A7